MIGQIDTGIHPNLPYLSELNIRLTRLDGEGRPTSSMEADKGEIHGSQVASIIGGPFYDKDLPQIKELKAIAIPCRGKTILCLLRALDKMLTANIRILCLPIGINLPSPVFRPFTKALSERGVLIVAPSGNKGQGIVLAPGSYPEVLTVGALDRGGNVASYSGRSKIEQESIFKPELFVRGEFPNPAHPGQGDTIRGTSMACAYLAGKAARIWQKHPNASLFEIRTKLGAKPLKPNSNPKFLNKRYVDKRLKAKLEQLDDDQSAEGLILSANTDTNGTKEFPMEQLLEELEKKAGCPPVEVNAFTISDIVHLHAPRRFFKPLLMHSGLYCAQAVDLSMLDM